MGLVSELRRRNVLRMVVLYVVAAWLIMQVAEVLIGLVKLPDWIGTTTLGLLAIGFPIALVFSWFYELTPEGISLEKDVEPGESITHVTGRRIDFLVISLLCAAVILFAYDKWGTSAPPEHSIAVLPFVNMSSDPEQGYFSDGISEDILNLLAQVPDLLVISRSSAFSFKGQNLDVPTIAAKLNVAHVLEGSVRKSENQLRITAQLIEVRTDTHLWSDTYDRELQSVFAVQDEIAAAVVDALKIKLLDPPKATPADPEAYALYLHGRNLTNQQDPYSVQKAETVLKRSLELDTGFAPAWTALGAVYWRQARFGLRRADEADELQRQAYREALAIDPQDGLALLGLVMLEGDATASYQLLQQVVASNPGDANALRLVGWLEFLRGYADEAIDLTERSIARDPLSPLGRGNLGYIYYYVDRLNDAADSIRMALALNPDALWAHWGLSLVLLAQGDAAAALAEIEHEPHDLFRQSTTALAQHAVGDTEAADATLQALLERYPGEHYFIAQVYAFRGEIDEAFERLEQLKENPRSNELGQSWIYILHADRLFSNLHDDPRWEAFLNTIGSPQE